jgi:hypothetical protein
MKNNFMVGTAEVDITPPIGTALPGHIYPRISKGIQDPLYIKSIVFESQGQRLAYVILDLIALDRKEGDKGVALAAERSGISQDHIVWAATHTHTGAYTTHIFSPDNSVINKAWLETIPEKFADCVAAADAAKVPARMSRLCAFNNSLLHNRRLLFKDGRAINTWKLIEADTQCIGSSGPVDPEIGILAFDDLNGNLLSVLFHFSLHTNTNFGEYFSADYPGVVAARIRERFGSGVSTLFLPGAQADINSPGQRYKEVGDTLAKLIIAELDKRQPVEEPPMLVAVKKEVEVPFRDFTKDQKERIEKAGYHGGSLDVFLKEVELLRKEGKTSAKTVLQAWRIGDIGFASLPGELFVEWGLKIKRESPFPWTYPIELGGDYLGYLITDRTWKDGGYESLIAYSSKPTPKGVGLMVDNVLKMLKELYKS